MRKLLLTIALLSGLPAAFAQQQVTIDLAGGKPKDINISSGTVQIELVNTLKPTLATYQIQTSVVNTLPPPISGLNGVQAGTPTVLTNSTTCPNGAAVLASIAAVNTATTEQALKQKFDAVIAAIAALPAACQKEANDLLAEQDAKRRQTTLIPGLKANQVITVTISRFSNGLTVADKIWEFKMSTESAMDKWLIHYGFTYQPNIITKYPQYFAKADPDAANTYAITRMNGHPERNWENVTPTVLLTHPFAKKYRDFMLGASIIAGTNFNTYSAGAGISGIIAYNGLISMGVMYSQKYDLNGQYEEGDIVNENLSFDQLHTKRGGFEFYISIGIRLDKNPFTANSGNSGGASSGSSSSTPTP